MNLKRAFLALGAMILGVGFFGASAAHATPHYTPHAPCIDWAVSSTVWPAASAGDTHFFICDGSYQNHSGPSAMAISGVRNAAQNQSAVVRAKMMAHNVDVFVFTDPTAYNTYVGASAQQAPAGVGGLTAMTMQPVGHTGPAVSIFETYCPNPPTGCLSVHYLVATKTVNHEIGHVIDNISGVPSLQTGTGKFKTQFDLDRTAFDNYAGSINWSGLPSHCNVTGNFAKLKCWLDINFSIGSNDFYKEFFAECYAGDQPGGGYPSQPSAILSSFFSTGGMAPSGTVRSCTIANNIAQTP